MRARFWPRRGLGISAVLPWRRRGCSGSSGCRGGPGPGPARGRPGCARAARSPRRPGPPPGRCRRGCSGRPGCWGGPGPGRWAAITAAACASASGSRPSSPASSRAPAASSEPVRPAQERQRLRFGEHVHRHPRAQIPHRPLIAGDQHPRRPGSREERQQISRISGVV